ncbi:DUF262 domain-containing protein [Myxococcus virescens]|uniref:DUF262 domain-containing protein n=1 Tax=Myxococcus virescens TaxID=83456 RepID=UPI003DA54AB5
MNKFKLGSFQNSGILYIYAIRDTIWTTPPYQRQGDIWPIEKRQLLIDSIINGYDIPKLYFHAFRKPKSVNGVQFDYAVIDGKQRLQCIFDFIDGKISLADDFEYIHDASIKLGGLTYQELAKEHPITKIKFDSFTLPIITVETDDTDFIDEMFARLNEAVPLNAAEKRNAFSGPIPPITRKHAQLAFFTNKLPFDNKRYRHFELATKFMYIEHRENLIDTKKAYLDSFVRSFTAAQAKDAAALGVKSEKTLLAMTPIFIDGDPLLRSVGMIVLYYYLFRTAQAEGWLNTLSRGALSKFETIRKENRELAEKGEVESNYNLLEFDRLTQSPNDAVALQFRYAVLRRHVGPSKGRPAIPGQQD